MLQINIPYHPNSTFYYEKVRHFDWPLFIDSCFQASLPQNPLVRYDIIAAQPFKKIIEQDGGANLYNNDEVTFIATDPVKLLKKEMASFKVVDSELPFTGGAIVIYLMKEILFQRKKI